MAEADDGAVSPELLSMVAEWHYKPRRVDVKGFCPHCGVEVTANVEAPRKELKVDKSEADPRQMRFPDEGSEA